MRFHLLSHVVLPFVAVVALVALVPAPASAESAPPFDHEAAARALRRDFDACLPADATPVFVDVTFEPSGELSAVANARWGGTPKTLKRKTGPVPDAVVACIRKALDGARVPAFAGPAVTVKKVADVSAKAACAEVVVGAAPHWVPLWIDGVRAGDTPVARHINAGEHELRWEQPGGKTGTQVIRLACGERVAVFLSPDTPPRVSRTSRPTR